MAKQNKTRVTFVTHPARQPVQGRQLLLEAQELLEEDVGNPMAQDLALRIKRWFAGMDDNNNAAKEAQ